MVIALGDTQLSLSIDGNRENDLGSGRRAVHRPRVAHEGKNTGGKPVRCVIVAIKWKMRIRQAARLTPCRRSRAPVSRLLTHEGADVLLLGIDHPQALDDLELPFFAWAMYMFMRT